METEVSIKYYRTDKALRKLMKTVQRELEDGELKIEFLSALIGLIRKLDNDGKEPDGRKSSIRKKQS